MKNNFNLDDLEQFLSEATEQHRMYPSDRVWRNIDQEINGRKRWPALTFGAILTGAIITAGLILVHPDKTLLTAPANYEPTQTISSVVSSSTSTIQHNKEKVTEREIAFTENEPNHSISVPFATASSTPASGNKYEVNTSSAESENHLQEPSTTNFADDQIDANTPQNIAVLGSYVDQSENRVKIGKSVYASGFTAKHKIADLKPESSKQVSIKNDLELLQSGKLLSNTEIKLPGSTNAEKTTTGLKRWSYTVYATPSISYRYLSEAKTTDLHFQNNGPIAPNLTHGVNNFVTHTPLPGYELGGGILYNLSKSVRVKTGLQLNLRGYRIDAYAAKREVSTIMLNSNGYTPDSLVTISTIGTQDGYMPKQVNNRYFEISVPVGIDMAVVNWKKIKLYVGAGVQPTYQFNGSMYMVSTDYKKYVQEPDLARHWNINTSLETFLSYQTGDISLQLGPQIRYQILPGAVNKYPIKERLIDYGLKLGVVKTLK